MGKRGVTLSQSVSSPYSSAYIPEPAASAATAETVESDISHTAARRSTSDDHDRAPEAGDDDGGWQEVSRAKISKAQVAKQKAGVGRSTRNPSTRTMKSRMETCIQVLVVKRAKQES